MPGERLDQRVVTVVLPILEAGECAHRDEVAVARQHFGDLDDMLLGLAVHYLHLPGIEFDPTHAVARRQDFAVAPSWAAPIWNEARVRSPGRSERLETLATVANVRCRILRRRR